MNEAVDNIFSRRSVRKYKNIPVSIETISQLIDAAKMAPSAMNRQDWKFYVVTNQDLIKSMSHEITHIGLRSIKDMKVSDALKTTLSLFHFSRVINVLKHRDHVFHGAPVVIFITSPKNDEWGALNTGMCAENLMLSAKALGLGSCPVGFARFVSQTQDYQSLHIPDKDEVQLAVVAGYADEEPVAGERIEDNVFYIS